MNSSTMEPLSTSLRVPERPGAEAVETEWRPLYRVAGAAALLTALLIPIQIAVFVLWPPPLDGTASDWFAMLQENRLIGLLNLDLLLLVDYVLLVPIYLALYVALRRTSPSWALIGTGLFFVAAAAYFASNTAFELLALSNRHAAAATEAERAMLLAAGEAMFATWEGTAFHLNYIVGQLAGIILGVVMLRSHLFGRVIAYLMIGGNAVGFGLYLPVIGVALSAGSGIVLWAWYILIARRFLQLGQGITMPGRHRHREGG